MKKYIIFLIFITVVIGLIQVVLLQKQVSLVLVFISALGGVIGTLILFLYEKYLRNTN